MAAHRRWRILVVTAGPPWARTLQRWTAGGPLNLIRALIGVFIAVLRSVTSSLVLMISTLITAVAVVALVGFLATGMTGVLGLRLSRRRPGK